MLVSLQLALFVTSTLISSTSGSYNVQPFMVHFPPKEVSRMITLAENTRLPSGNQFAGGDNSLGISRDTLQDLKHEWVHEYNWTIQENALNKYHQYTVEVENLTLHFIHEKSADSTAIPILMAHGWPGSFLEYLPTVPLLTQSLSGGHGRNISYNVVIPSLPGFGFSSLPSNTWSPEDTARIFNTLMVDILGYEHYTVFGSDWGSSPTYTLYSQYSSSVRAAHFVFIPFVPYNAEQLATENITLSPFEQEGLERMTNNLSGNGYFIEQTTRPNTIGFALQDSPLGQLAWIGEKIRDWSDPDRSPPSTLTNTTILDSVSLYFLTQTFLSAEWMYSRASLKNDYPVERPTAPMGYSAFRYNIAQWPRALVEKVGNLTVYQEHARGGHFPGIDNPAALVADIRELGRLWEY